VDSRGNVNTQAGRLGSTEVCNARGIRGSCSGNVSIERRRGDAETVRGLSHADVRICEHYLGGLDVVLREFLADGLQCGRAPRGGKAAWVQPGTTGLLPSGAIPNITSTAIAP
jgi:hypothetical protein